MRHIQQFTIIGALVAALLSSTAFAGNIVDKGALGKYERQGRFLKPIMKVPARTSSRLQATPANEGTVLIEKGELGSYQRHGRFVRPVIDDVQNSWTNSTRPRYFPIEKPRTKVRLGLPHR
jgi:hypothetical protein